MQSTKHPPDEKNCLQNLQRCLDNIKLMNKVVIVSSSEALWGTKHHAWPEGSSAYMDWWWLQPPFEGCVICAALGFSERA
jgi:hypothetical protein